MARPERRSLCFLGAAALAVGLMSSAAPTQASAPQHTICDESDDLLEVEALTTDVVLTIRNDGSTQASLSEPDFFARVRSLAPLAEAAIRDVFDSEKTEAETDLEDSEELRPVNAQLPGVSDDRLIHFRKQMFRRDI